MYDVYEYKATPANARIFLEWASLRNMPVDDAVKDLAMKDLLPKDSFRVGNISLSPAQREAMQYLDDRLGRALILDGNSMQSRAVALARAVFRNSFPLVITGLNPELSVWAELLDNLSGKKVCSIPVAKPKHKEAEIDNDADIYLSDISGVLRSSLFSVVRPKAMIFECNKMDFPYGQATAITGLCKEVHSTTVLLNLNAVRKTNMVPDASAILTAMNWHSMHNNILDAALRTIFDDNANFISMIQMNNLKRLTDQGYPAKPNLYLDAFGICTTLLK